MPQPTLVILAAGMGSRYGGLKQIEPVDEYGNIIIDYSIYDALRAGFRRIVCIIKKEMEDGFNDIIGRRIARHAELRLAYQELSMLPPGYAVPQGRVKPWGTAHALVCCRKTVDGPFAVINADDYYGVDAYHKMFAYLNGPRPRNEYAMVGYALKNTLSANGAVTRGVCETDGGCLTAIRETSGIRPAPGGGVYTDAGRDIALPGDTVVSMNLWGFDEGLLAAIEADFPAFLDTAASTDPLRAEYLLPSAVQTLMRRDGIRVRVLESRSQWYGITYREDMPPTRAAIRALKAQGVYGERLWE